MTKKSIAALAVLASSVTANATGDWACLPAFAWNDEVSNIALCDASQWNIKNQSKYQLVIDSYTGCATSATTDEQWITFIPQTAAYKGYWDEKSGAEVKTELRECSDEEALSMMVEL